MMRVSYTLPGFLPAEATPAEPARTGDGPFRMRLNFVPAPRWADWKGLLGLDQAPVNASAIGPPPRPASLDAQDATTQRRIWRQMLDRQVSAAEDSSSELNSTTESNNRDL